MHSGTFYCCSAAACVWASWSGVHVAELELSEGCFYQSGRLNIKRAGRVVPH